MMAISNTSARQSMWSRTAIFFTALAVAGASSQPASPQCPTDWLSGEGHPGVTGDLPVWAVTTWDPDGAGPQPEVLVAGGGFEGAGDVATWGIASWDGAEWRAVGGTGTPGVPGANDQVMALTVYNGDVVAAGFFTNIGGVPANRIARWDGTAWHALGSGLNVHSVRALAVYNGELYAGGQFEQAGGVPAAAIARWNGSSWQDVAGSVTLVSKTGGIASVFAMTVFDGKLIVGGGFTSAGGVPADNIASWDGSNWQSMDGGVYNFGVEALGVYNGSLIAGAGFQGIGNIAQWNGTAWQPMGAGTPNDRVLALTQYNSDLYIGGIFTNVAGFPTPVHLARWNSSSWASVPGGPGVPGRKTQSLGVFNGDLIAGGLTTKPDGNQMSGIGRWDGSAWHVMGGGADGVVLAVASYQGDVFIGGQFFHGDIEASGIARRAADGTWDSLLGGVSGAGAAVQSMAVYEDTLIVSGSFTTAGSLPVEGIARWDGKSWQAFGSEYAASLFVHDDQLFGVTGTSAGTVSRWNPLTQQWQPLGALPPNVVIRRLARFNGELIAAGLGFNGAPAAAYRWDGASWHPLPYVAGGGTFGFSAIEAVVEYNGELIAGGDGPPGGIVRWTGTTWETLAGGLFEDGMMNFTFGVSDLIVFNGDLYVVGAFSHAGQPFGVLARSVARWNGSTWSGVGAGANSQVLDICDHNGGLLMGGWFTMAGGSPNGHWARLGEMCGPGDVNHDGLVDVDDLIAVILSWGACANCGECPPDVNGTCVVDVDDLILVILNWT